MVSLESSLGVETSDSHLHGSDAASGLPEVVGNWFVLPVWQISCSKLSQPWKRSGQLCSSNLM